MLTCREVNDVLMDYLDGALDAGQRRAFEEHLAACPPCVNYMKTYQEAVRLGRAAFSTSDKPAEEELPEDLIRSILAATKE